MLTKMLAAIALFSLFALGTAQAAELQSSRDPARHRLPSVGDGIDHLEKKLADLREPHIRIQPQPARGV